MNKIASDNFDFNISFNDYWNRMLMLWIILLCSRKIQVLVGMTHVMWKNKTLNIQQITVLTQKQNLVIKLNFTYFKEQGKIDLLLNNNKIVYMYNITWIFKSKFLLEI
jgi:hypothetical protein